MNKSRASAQHRIPQQLHSALQIPVQQAVAEQEGQERHAAEKIRQRHLVIAQREPGGLPCPGARSRRVTAEMPRHKPEFECAKPPDASASPTRKYTPSVLCSSPVVSAVLVPHTSIVILAARRAASRISSGYSPGISAGNSPDTRAAGHGIRRLALRYYEMRLAYFSAHGALVLPVRQPPAALVLEAL